MAAVTINGVNHFAISVPDLEGTIQWYHDIFGFELYDRSEIPGAGIKIAHMTGHNLILEIFSPIEGDPLPEERKTPNLDIMTCGNKHISFGVPDGETAKKQLLDAGVEIVMEARVDGTYGIFIHDNTGNLIEIFEEAGEWYDGTKPSAMAYDPAGLIQAAIDQLKNSYAPYSGFNVSAAVLTDTGNIYTGVNIENASYPAGICAERNAIGNAVSNGEKNIIAIAIAGGANYKITDYCPPCGICRQVMREFGDPGKLKVVMGRSAADYKEMLLQDLFPESFGPEHLKESKK